MGIINIFISAVLALIYPGAGQIYNGQTKKGFWFFGIGITLWLLSETVFTRLWFERGIILPFQLWTVIDALVVAIGIYRGKRDLSFVRNWKGFVKIAIVIVVPMSLVLGKAVLERVVLFDYIERASKPPEDLAEVQKEIMEYLENKYDQEFEVVQDVKYDSAFNTFSLTARPKDNRRVTFSGTKFTNGKLEDNFLSQLWDLQLKDEIKPLIDEMYPFQNRWDIYMDVTVSKSLNEVIDHKNVPDYQEIRKQYPDKTSLELDIYLFKNLNESNKDKELEKVYRLIQFLRENGIQRFSVEVLYYEEILLKEKGRDIEVGGEFYDYLRYLISIREEEAKTVRTPEDLEKHLIEYPG